MQNKHLSFAFSCVTDYFGSLNRRKSISEEETANVNTKATKGARLLGQAGGRTEDEGQMKIQKKEEENN